MHRISAGFVELLADFWEKKLSIRPFWDAIIPNEGERFD